VKIKDRRYSSTIHACLAGVAILASVSSTAMAQQAGAPPPPSVSTVNVAPTSVPLSYEYAARVSAFRQTEVRARVGGILLKRNFVEGAQVKAGDVLFLIDPEPYEAALKQAEAGLKQAQAQLSQALREEKRNISLFDQNVGSEKSRDDAISTRELADAAVASAEAQVQTARLNLGYTKVTAPIDGVTSLEQVSEGSLISTDSSLLTSITQLDPVYVNFSFSDSEAREVHHLMDLKKNKGEDTKLHVGLTFGDGSTYNHEGLVDFTSATVDVNTGTIQARAVIDNPERQLIPGQFVRATVSGVTADAAIVIPEISLMQSPQGQFVYTVGADGKAKINSVTLGQKVGSNWIVTSGLNAGEQLITEGVIKVRPGSPVQPTPAAEADAATGVKKVATN
jgi:membrane fusion protein (multidrug efflux system)